MKKKIKITGFLFLIFLLILSGCLDIIQMDNGSLIYESHATKISYDIEYGYYINTSGIGSFEIEYLCDKPEVLAGSIETSILHNLSYNTMLISGNDFIKWDISDSDEKKYKLGISCDVESENYFISDLTGENAFTIEEIKNNYPGLYGQYTKDQKVEDVFYIETNNSVLKNVAENVYNNAQTDNSFLVAKELFYWLKQNTQYKLHNSGFSSAQPAITTYNKKTGDCDDLSILYINLCRSLGIPSRFIRGILVQNNNGVLSAVSHAWVEVFIGNNIGLNGWIPMEVSSISDNVDSQFHQNFGMETANHLRLFTGFGSDESMNISLKGPNIRYDTNLDVSLDFFIDIDNYFILETGELVIKDNQRYYQ